MKKKPFKQQNENKKEMFNNYISEKRKFTDLFKNNTNTQTENITNNNKNNETNDLKNALQTIIEKLGSLDKELKRNSDRIDFLFENLTN